MLRSGFGIGALLAMLALANILPAAAQSAAQSAPNAGVAVRVYNNADIAPRDLDEGRRGASALLRQAGVESTWRFCRLAKGQSPPGSTACDDVLGGAEVIVRIQQRGTQGSDSLGYSYVDTLTGTGSLATVFADRVRAAAGNAGLDTGLLLGRVLAHEIGHLLLGRAEHSESGLMRAHWPGQALSRNLDDDWIFSGSEASELREAIVARLQHGTGTPRLRRAKDAAGR
jgi:hypothetical protein